MKTLLILLLFPITSLAQTGKYKTNVSVGIYFSEGTFEITNKNQCPSVIQMAFLGDTVIIVLGPAKSYKFTTNENNFVLSARNTTNCVYTDDNRWLTIDSEIRALEIKLGQVKNTLIRRCNEKTLF